MLKVAKSEHRERGGGGRGILRYVMFERSLIYIIGVGAGPVLAGPLFLAVPAGPVFGQTTRATF